MKNKELILSLIKDDLIHSKLLTGLNALGLQTDGFIVGLSETVFELMGIANDENGEQLFENYMEMREKVSAIDMSELEGKVKEMAEKMFLQLLENS